MPLSRNITFLIFTASVSMCAGCDLQKNRIYVSTNPAGAAVYCNNQKIGVSPVSVTLPKNKQSAFTVIYVIEARLSGYAPAREYLTEGEPGDLKGREVKLTLQPLPKDMTDSDIPEIGKYIPRGMPSNYLSRVTCEIMLVRVSDGKVLKHASGMACDDYLIRLSEQLTSIIKLQVPAGPSGTLAVCQLRNRRETQRGSDLADQLTRLISREMSFNSPRGVATDINLKPLVGESQMDKPKALKKPRVQECLKGIDYVIIGGVAEAIVP